MYYALKLWAAIEDTLGDYDHAAKYNDFADSLKTSFNKTTATAAFGTLKTSGTCTGETKMTPFTETIWSSLSTSWLSPGPWTLQSTSPFKHGKPSEKTGDIGE